MNPPSKPLREQLENIQLHDHIDGSPLRGLRLGIALSKRDIQQIMQLFSQELERVVEDIERLYENRYMIVPNEITSIMVVNANQVKELVIEQRTHLNNIIEGLK